MSRINSTEDWLAAFPREATEREVRELEARLAKAEERLVRTQREVTELHARLAPRKQALALWSATQATMGEAQTADLGRSVVLWHAFRGASADAALHDWMSGSRPTLRAAIHKVLEEAGGRPLKLSEIRDRLLANGWVADDENGVHRVQMMASDMAKKGQLIRPQTGFYMLPEQAGAEGDAEAGG